MGQDNLYTVTEYAPAARVRCEFMSMGLKQGSRIVERKLPMGNRKYFVEIAATIWLNLVTFSLGIVTSSSDSQLAAGNILQDVALTTLAPHIPRLGSDKRRLRRV